MDENSYGVKKRMDFLQQCMNAVRPSRVLDFGCGTGSALTIPLAKKYPDIRFIGLESDSSSINKARLLGEGCPNLRFEQQLTDDTKFDLIIASEVIEHVDDYPRALAYLHSLLRPGGFLFFTVPNGYGPFEYVSLFESVLRRWKQKITGKKKRTKAISSNEEETLANSPHINFFHWSEILPLIRKSGFRVDIYRGRTVFCGLLLSPWIDASSKRKSWNADLADRVSPQLVSGWMFLLSRAETPEQMFTPCPMSALAKLKRKLNLINSEGAR